MNLNDYEVVYYIAQPYFLTQTDPQTSVKAKQLPPRCVNLRVVRRPAEREGGVGGGFHGTAVVLQAASAKAAASESSPPKKASSTTPTTSLDLCVNSRCVQLTARHPFPPHPHPYFYIPPRQNLEKETQHRRKTEEQNTRRPVFPVPCLG